MGREGRERNTGKGKIKKIQKKKRRNRRREEKVKWMKNGRDGKAHKRWGIRRDAEMEELEEKRQEGIECKEWRETKERYRLMER